MRSKLLVLTIASLALGVVLSGTSYAMPSDADSDTTQLTKVFPAEMSLPPDVGGVPLTFGFGATTDYIIDRNLDADDAGLSKSDLTDNVWTGGNIYYDPHEKVHLNLFLGTAWLKVGNVALQNSSGTTVMLNTDSAFAIGGSGKVDVTQFQVIEGQPQMNLFASGGYRFTNPDVDTIGNGGGFNATVFDLNVEVNEWNATLGVSQRINDPMKLWFGLEGWNFAWVPYVGVQYSDLDLNISGTSDLPNTSIANRQQVQTGHRNAEDVVNVITGMQIIAFGDKLSIGLEGRFVSETAVSLNGHFRW